MSLNTTDLVTNDPIPKASDYLIYPWLQPGRLTLMAGPTEIGKTTITLEMIAAVLRGGHLWDRFPCRRIGRILYLHGEHTLETLREAAKARGDIPATAVSVLHDFGEYGTNLLERGAPRTQLLNELWRIIRDTRPELIIAEPISAFLGTSENDNREARLLVNILSSLGARIGAAVLTHHHFGKSQFDTERMHPEGIPGGEARGAQSFEDAPERLLYLKRVGKRIENRVVIETPKPKGFPVAPVTLQFDEDTLTYHYISQPFVERDLIALYDRRRKHPTERITDLVDYFRTVWKGASPNRIFLLLRRAARVGLIEMGSESLPDQTATSMPPDHCQVQSTADTSG